MTMPIKITTRHVYIDKPAVKPTRGTAFGKLFPRTIERVDLTPQDRKAKSREAVASTADKYISRGGAFTKGGRHAR